MKMIARIAKFRRAFRTCLRAFRASIRGPEKGKAKVRRVLSSLKPEHRALLPEDLEDAARVYFSQKAYDRTRKAIRRARTSIHMQMFIWKADATGRDMAELLVAAANRGVMVTVHKEVIGDVFEMADDFAATKHDAHPSWQSFWKHPRISVLHENRHDHSKTYIIDNELLLVSSMNIGDAYCNDWHECMVELRGKQFVDQYRAHTTILPRLTGDGSIQVLRSSSENPMLTPVLELLRGAKKIIRIEMAYFSDPEIIELLAQKTHEGVYVFLVLPHSPDLHHHSNLHAAGRLLKLAKKHHAFVFRYPRGLLHTKMIIVDRRTLFIGSTNLMRSSLVKMAETNVLIHRYPRRCLRVARRRFTKDALQSIQVEAEQLSRTSWQKFLTWFGF